MTQESRNELLEHILAAIKSSQGGYSSVVIVHDASDLAAPTSDKVYILDGHIDMGTTSIPVPLGGITIRGWGFDASGLISSEPAHVMFVNGANGGADCGKVYLTDMYMECTAGKVFELKGATGSETLELRGVNFNNCDDLGYVDGFRQGLETGNGRFGGSPSLELRGNWLGGYRMATNIVRGVSASCDTLFRAGAGFTMQSRFKTDVNADLGSTASLFDFSAANFPTENTLIIEGAEITRNGVVDATDTTIYPNIDNTAVQCRWNENIGLPSTHTGGVISVAGEQVTTISAVDVFTDVEYLSLGAQAAVHFDAVNNGKGLRHLGNNPREYSISASYVVGGSPNDEIELAVFMHDDSTNTDFMVASQMRAINNSQGGNDVAYFTIFGYANLDNNDYLYMRVTNKTASRDVTAKVDSFFLVRER